jgi:hypothetical protein
MSALIYTKNGSNMQGLAVAMARVPGAPEPLASMVTLLTPAGTVQLTLAVSLKVLVKMIQWVTGLG